MSLRHKNVAAGRIFPERSEEASSDRYSELHKQLLNWRLEPASRPLSQLAEQAKSLARRLGRGEIEVDVSGDNVRLDMQHWSPFFAELVHVVRNAVDHDGAKPKASSRTAKSSSDLRR